MKRGAKTPLDKKYRIVRMIERGEITAHEAAMRAGVSERTIRRWLNRYRKHGRKALEDKRKGKGAAKLRKVTPEIARQIEWIRKKYGWGSSRIKKALMAPPKPLAEAYEKETGEKFKKIKLARSTIIYWLAKLGLNGSPYKNKKFNYKKFEKGSANKMWQVDIKCTNDAGETKYIMLILDDHSRYLIDGEVFEKTPKSLDTARVLSRAIKKYGKPSKILTDNGSEFKKTFRHLPRGMV